ncbi:50S ribosomal protein L3 [Candidatus Gracilibacteria bacterium]|nr:50S ribosomal protein L3 [Candidatus Gracilibacteria bacterium]
MPGLIAKKLEMTRVIKGYKFIPVTLLEIPVLKVVAKKTIEKDGYSAFSVGVVDQKNKKELTLKDGKTSLNLNCFSEIREFFCEECDLEKYNVGDELGLNLLEGVESVVIEGFSKGKGFAGAMKRHNFSGGPGRVGSKFHRALGSIGNRKPRRTHKGKKMHGHMGNEKVTIKKVPVELVNKELNVVGVRGGVPGGRNSSVKIILN